MKLYGLIGKPLTHSFSAVYFENKFLDLGISETNKFQIFPLENIDELHALLQKHPQISGLNVTVPYKKKVLHYCSKFSPEVEKISASNTLKIVRNMDNSIQDIIAYNTDVFGFSELIKKNDFSDKNVLILGNGGASAAVQYVLASLHIPFKIASRNPKERNQLTYPITEKKIFSTFQVIINTTPLGMYPNLNTKPDLDYDQISKSHTLIDLVYNPATTAFMGEGIKRSAKVINGEAMLYAQADKAWEIWST